MKFGRLSQTSSINEYFNIILPEKVGKCKDQKTNVAAPKFWKRSTASKCFQCIIASPYLTLRCFVLLHMKKIALKPPFSCWDPLPHLQYCRTECYQKQTDELKKERKPFIQLSVHIACHLCATFSYGPWLAASNSHPAPANHRTWP